MTVNWIAEPNPLLLHLYTQPLPKIAPSSLTVRNSLQGRCINLKQESFVGRRGKLRPQERTIYGMGVRVQRADETRVVRLKDWWKRKIIRIGSSEFVARLSDPKDKRHFTRVGRPQLCGFLERWYDIVSESKEGLSVCKLPKLMRSYR